MRVLVSPLVVGLVLGACKSLPVDYPRQESRSLRDTAGTQLGRAVAPSTNAHPGLSGVHPLVRGTDAFVARLVLAAGSERSLDVQYYIWRNDTTGRILLDHLLRAADRGVRVRLLVDDLGTAADDAGLLAIDAHPNIELRLFNPIAARGARGLGALADFARVNRRMHNKSFTADNQVTIVGGRNIGDEYFEAQPDLDFADLDVMAVGPVVQQVSGSFDKYWNSDSAYPIAALASAKMTGEQTEQARAALRQYSESQRGSAYTEALRNSALARGLVAGILDLYWCRAEALYDDPAKVSESPEDQSTHLLPKLARITEATQHELLLVSPYFVPGEAGVEYFRGLRSRGVQVTVLTNSLAATDVSAVHAGYSRYREPLLEAGVALYEVKPTARRAGGVEKRNGAGGSGLRGSSRASLHAKVFTFDRKAVFVGSLNLDPRSAVLNTEIGLLFESPELATLVAEQFIAAFSRLAYRLELVSRDPGSSDSLSKLEWVERKDDGEMRYDTEPQVGGWRRLVVWLLSWLPIESQL
ncbi:MAG: phospholipase D family protein [Betaproteobacteria bacterium]